MSSLAELVKQLSYYAKGDPRLRCDNITLYQALRLAKRELKRLDQRTGKVVIRTDKGSCSISSYERVPEPEWTEIPFKRAESGRDIVVNPKDLHP